MQKSFKVGCKTRGDVNWTYNGLRFATQAEADQYGSDLFSRWMALEKFETHECADPVKNAWVDGKLVFLETTPAEAQTPALVEAA